MDSTQALVRSYDGIPLADSRDIAVQLDVEHRSFFKMILEYQEEVEKDFGQLRFEFAVGYRPQGGGNPSRYALLNKLQTFTYLNYSQNTDKARYAKRMYVKAFDELEQEVVRLKEQATDSPLQGIGDFVNGMLADDNRRQLFAKGLHEADRGKQKMIDALLGSQKPAQNPVQPSLPSIEKPAPTPEHIQAEILRHMDRLSAVGKAPISVTDIRNCMPQYTRTQLETQCRNLVGQGVLQAVHTSHTVKYERVGKGI